VNPLLLRQLKRAAGVDGEAALELLLAQLCLLTHSKTLPPEIERLAGGLGELLRRVSASYDHHERHLELFGRSMELSLEELEIAQAGLLQSSRTDALTQLWNRGYWSERLEEEFRRAQRMGVPASLVVFDIDHFKQVNDSFGHAAGDEVIKHAARLTQVSARSMDICGRYGGEEFAVILPGSGEDGAMRFAEALRLQVAAVSCVHEGRALPVTISLGIAALAPEIESAARWFARADAALYAAKRAGRNRSDVWVPGAQALPG
jgi:diguanylate cyclase (GGDEF)-like protein